MIMMKVIILMIMIMMIIILIIIIIMIIMIIMIILIILIKLGNCDQCLILQPSNFHGPYALLLESRLYRIFFCRRIAKTRIEK